MANEAHLAILRQGVDVWNQWRQESQKVRPDLSGADLIGTKFTRADLSLTDLAGADLSLTDLSGADLYGSNLIQVNLYGAKLNGTRLNEAKLNEAKLNETMLNQATFGLADLSRADLSGADLMLADLYMTKLIEAKLIGTNFLMTNLEMADLSRADMSGADLERANLRRTVLEGATFTQAIFGYTTLIAVDLRSVQNLDTVEHRGPSSIGLDTIELSQGRIPSSFLRGCGVSDRLIEYIPSLTVQPIQYYSCFISYSSADEALAKRLHADLQAAGVRCWFAPHDMQIGDSIIDRIDQAIRLHEKLLLILSESSVASRWVEAETKTALMRERNEGHVVLFPIRLDDAVLQASTGWAAQVRERHIGDFRQWKDHNAYQQAFARLLRDLRAEDAIG